MFMVISATDKKLMEYSVVGHDVSRVDAVEKVMGKGRFCSDLELPGILYGKALRSTCAHARIISIDTLEAERLPGVRGVVTGRDAPQKRSGGMRYAFDQHVMAKNVVRFVGEAVAAVAADTIEIAERAVELIKVEYRELPAVFDVEEAWTKEPLVVVHPDLPGYEKAFPSMRLAPDRPNVANHYRVRHGDVKRGFQEADLIMEDRFTTARIQHCALEPHTSIVQVEPDGSVTLWSGRQGLYGARQYLCRTFDLPPSKVRVNSSFYVGGGFGSKFKFTVEPIALLLARKTGRPVRMALTREEIFVLGGHRIPCVIHIKDGVKRDGTLVAREMRLLVNTGAYASNGGALLTKNTSFGAIGTYRVPNFKFDAYAVYTNEPPVCALRGFASEQATWAIECHTDAIAERLGLGAVETRKKNLLKEGDVNANGEVVHSIGAGECLDKVAGFLKSGVESEGEGGLWRRGKGLALGNKYSMSTAVSVSIVKVLEDGVIEVRFSADELGQGANTVMAQITAEEFGVSVDMVKVVWGDTAVTPYSTQSLSQGTTYNCGNSTILACEDAKRQLFELAAGILEAGVQDMVVKAGKVYVKSAPERSINIAEVYKRGYVEKWGEILGRGVWVEPFAPDNPETGQVEPELAKSGVGLTSFYAYAAQGAEVAVNVETGEVKVVRFSTACDMGFPINPKMCEQQMDGGAVMGIGSALWEDVILDKGKVLNTNLRDYKIPDATCIPRLEDFRTFMAPAPHRRGPYGAKGMGEVVLTPTAPAIANAIYNAVAVRIKDLPLNREKVFKALRAERL
jgi:CO/xanthine dehydrogenase Mo-binding subunit